MVEVVRQVIRSTTAIFLQNKAQRTRFIQIFISSLLRIKSCIKEIVILFWEVRNQEINQDWVITHLNLEVTLLYKTQIRKS